MLFYIQYGIAAWSSQLKWAPSNSLYYIHEQLAMLLKVEPPTLAEIKMINPETIIISAIQLKTKKKEYFEALAQKKITALAFEYIKDEDGSYLAVKSRE